MLENTIFLSEHHKSIDIEYSDNDLFFGDTVVRIYDCYKISVVLSNGSAVVIGSKILFPQRGDILIFRPNEIHFGSFPTQSTDAFLSFLTPVDIFDEIVINSKDILAPFLDNSAQRINMISTPEKYRSELIDIAVKLLLLMRNEQSRQCFDVIAFSKFIEVLDICCKCYPGQKELGDAQSLPPIISKTLSKIHESFPDFIGLEALAEYCGCSVTYLTQTFRKYTGKTIYNYLTESRLERARLLLKNGHSVTEAAYQSGFSDTSRFILQFKKNFGITPGKYSKSGQP